MGPPSLTNLAFANWSVECVVCPKTKDSFQFPEIKSGILGEASGWGSAWKEPCPPRPLVRAVPAQELQAHLAGFIMTLKLALPSLPSTPVLRSLLFKNAAFGVPVFCTSNDVFSGLGEVGKIKNLDK